MTSLPSGSISWTLDENKEFGLCNMQVPLECSVPDYYYFLPIHSSMHTQSDLQCDLENCEHCLEISQMCLLCYDQSQQRSGHAN